MRINRGGGGQSVISLSCGVTSPSSIDRSLCEISFRMPSASTISW